MILRISVGEILDEYTATIENEVVNFREDDGKERLFMTYQQTINAIRRLRILRI